MATKYVEGLGLSLARCSDATTASSRSNSARVSQPSPSLDGQPVRGCPRRSVVSRPVTAAPAARAAVLQRSGQLVIARDRLVAFQGRGAGW
jgi:hypothetical protein